MEKSGGEFGLQVRLNPGAQTIHSGLCISPSFTFSSLNIDFIFRQVLSSPSSSNLAAHQVSKQSGAKLSFPGAPAKVLQLSLIGFTWMICLFRERG